METFLTTVLWGPFRPPVWVYFVYLLTLTHLTIITVTVYYHRAKAHRALTLHPWLDHAFRFWGWLTTGMSVKEWVAIHRYHHAKDDGPEDPHSPWVFGIWYVLFAGVVLYYEAAKRPEIMVHCRDIPDDWLEKHLYSNRRSSRRFYGVGLMLIINLTLFGAVGLLVWLVQMLWIPFWAAGVINGVGHWPLLKHFIGYRNTDTKDKSSNIVPWGIWIGGEELHNNHHARPQSAKLSMKWWEFDVGWMYIRIFELLRLANVKYTMDTKIAK
jgi:stearoyl-CoA desaturase (Delta-9 desaturase)